MKKSRYTAEQVAYVKFTRLIYRTGQNTALRLPSHACGLPLVGTITEILLEAINTPRNHSLFDK